MVDCVIYCRVSRAFQASEERVSISEQVRACEKLAEERGYRVVGTFIDDKKYRVGKKTKEPSGENSDRPAYLAMLKVVSEGGASVILAWREDRLARGVFGIIPLARTLKENPRVRVELVNGVFDQHYMMVKASIGELELQGIRERSMMGRAGKLRRGQLWSVFQRYGYKVVDDRLVPDEAQSPWVVKAFEWYLDRVPIAEICRRLAASAPPQDRKSGTHARNGWARSTVQQMLGAPEYAQGYIEAKMGDEVFKIPCPPIVSHDAFDRVQELKKLNQSGSEGRVIGRFLCRYLVTCACGRSWGVRTIRYRTGGGVRRTALGQYICPLRPKDTDCPRTVGARKLDSYVWREIDALLQRPGEVLKAIDEEIERRSRDPSIITSQADEARVRRELEKIPDERGFIIRLARQGRITEDDMSSQLEELESLELALQRELGEVTHVRDPLVELRERARSIGEFLAKIDIDQDLLSYDEVMRLEDEELKDQLFSAAQDLVAQLVRRVVVHRGGDIDIIYHFGLVHLASSNSGIDAHGRYQWSVARVS